MAVPCGMGGGLPISMMLVGKHFGESAIYRAAHAFAQAADWKSRSYRRAKRLTRRGLSSPSDP
jgi:Asp-tRNA(Asn)/Glu-tRNA(Gln) amidotransferase A subunit family amidase